MSNNENGAIICIDLRKSRIRIHKSTLHILGEPKYIQLLVNPEKMNVAIKSVETCLPGDNTHTVYKRILHSDNSYEIYSKTFVKKLCAVIGDLDPRYSYRMSGKIMQAHQAAVFSMKTLQKISNETGG